MLAQRDPLERAVYLHHAFRQFPKELAGDLVDDLDVCTLVMGQHVFRRVHFWGTAAVGSLPAVAAFEFSEDSPGALFCALPYELDVEPVSLSGTGSAGRVDLRGLYTPLPYDFPSPPFSDRAPLQRLVASAPHSILFLGASPSLRAFYRSADPILSLLARRDVGTPVRNPRGPEQSEGDDQFVLVSGVAPSPQASAATPVMMAQSTIPPQLAVPQSASPAQSAQSTNQQQQQQQQLTAVTQPSTPLMGAIPATVLPARCWLPARRGGYSVPSVAKWYCGVCDLWADDRDPHVATAGGKVFHKRCAPAGSTGIDRLAEAALDADTSIDDMEPMDAITAAAAEAAEGSNSPALEPTKPPTAATAAGDLAPAPVAAAPAVASTQRPYVVTPGLKTPDLDEEVARVLHMAKSSAAAAAMAAAAMEEAGIDGSDIGADDFDGGELDDYSPKQKRARKSVQQRRAARHKGESQLSLAGSQRHACHWAECDLLFGSVAELTAHLLTHTVAQAVHKCRWEGCVRNGKPFGNHSGLFRHLRYHTGDKPCRCLFEGCGFCSVDNGELRRHIKLVHHMDSVGDLPK